MSYISIVKSRLRYSAPHLSLLRRRDKAAVDEWCRAGSPGPPPQSYKRLLIRKTAREFASSIFVETGTHYGATVAAVLDIFKVIHSIELSEHLYRESCRRLARHKNVQLHHGDSVSVLPRILPSLIEPVFFWLDAHYAGDGTARGDHDTPIIRELRTIAENSTHAQVILIDDARFFDGTNGYPRITECEALLRKHWPRHKVEVQHDIIRVIPK